MIGLLAAAAFGRRYLSARRAGAVACVGITVLDGVMLITAVLAIPVLVWPVILAAAASFARLTFTRPGSARSPDGLRTRQSSADAYRKPLGPADHPPGPQR